MKRYVSVLLLFCSVLLSITGGCNSRETYIATPKCDGQLQAGEASIDAPFDQDGDGYLDGSNFDCVESYDSSVLDCDDKDPEINPGALEIACNGVDDDCTPDSPDEADVDGDGVGSCTDCDDENAAKFPGATEVCDGLDNDCDPGTDEKEDMDGDGYSPCPADSGQALADCDDQNPTVYPSANEACDGIDNDCDPSTDEAIDRDDDGFTTCDGDCNDEYAVANPDEIEICDGLDNNCDGNIDEGFDQDGDGSVVCVVGAELADCDDSNSEIGPQADEICDGIDNDCDGLIDDQDPTVSGGSTWYLDQDGDGLGTQDVSIVACIQPESYVEASGDCDDSNGAMASNQSERCDGLDNDCDGAVDEGLTSDEDGDGYSAPGSCSGSADDCDDGDPSTHPGAAEQCDGRDNDCDGSTDEDLAKDLDGDGVTDCAGDCNDSQSDVYPGAPEVCDSFDNDCDGLVDDEDTSIEGQTLYYPDGDEDGFGDWRYPVASCQNPEGYVENDKDCDDSDASIHPGVEEVCDLKDQNCNGQTDEGLSIDEDEDGYTAAESCDGSKNDCDDSNPDVSPAGVEICNGIDDDCDGFVDPFEVGNSGMTADCAIATCNLAKASVSSAKSGVYWLNPGGEDPFEVYCDMETDGGGWTLLVNVVNDEFPVVLGSALDESFIFPESITEILYGESGEVRFECESSNGDIIDLKVTDDRWLTRPYERGDACSQGYNWMPISEEEIWDVFTAIGDHNVETLKPVQETVCSGKQDQRLVLYQIGIYSTMWFIADGSISSRRCNSDRYGAIRMRVYYR